MRRTVLVIPELLAPDGESALDQRLPALQFLAEKGEPFRISPMGTLETPEALYLGLGPEEAQMPQGPLTVAALGAEPPEGSTHFHVSLASLLDGTFTPAVLPPTPEELRQILELAPKLNTKKLTFVAGEELDHALVWEGRGDMLLFPPDEAAGKPLREVLPQGDAEPLLRRFIDDSANLLTELELNERRLDEGLRPFNVFWPWGQGLRPRLPNLALRRGLPVVVESETLRMSGLARLAAYIPGDRHWLRHGMNLDLPKLAAKALKTDALLALISAPSGLRADGKFEELIWFMGRLDTELLDPLVTNARQSPAELLLVAPSAHSIGLGVRFRFGDHHQNSYPFTEEATEEKSLSLVPVWQAVAQALAP